MNFLWEPYNGPDLSQSYRGRCTKCKIISTITSCYYCAGHKLCEKCGLRCWQCFELYCKECINFNKIYISLTKCVFHKPFPVKKLTVLLCYKPINIKT